TITLGSGNGNDNYSATLTNGSTATLGLTKIGSGTQTLTGAGITYTGNTTINAGALALANTTGFASNVVFAATGTPKLQLSTPLISDAWTFPNTKTITGGPTGAIIEKTGLGSVTLTPAAGSTFVGGATAALTVTAGKLYVNNSNFSPAPAAS